VATNRATALVLHGAKPSLMTPRANVLTLCHHPDGLATRIANLAQLREHHAQRLQQQIHASGDAMLVELLAQLRRRPLPTAHQSRRAAGEHLGVVAPFQLQTSEGLLSFFTTSTVFGSVTDITLSELAMECFLPADEATAKAVRRLTRSLRAR